MKTKTFAQLATLVFVALLVVLAAPSTPLSLTTQAQQVKERTAEWPKWEYAVITDVMEIGRGDAASNIKFMGVAELCYYQESGCQKLKIEGENKVAALAKAVAKLGDDGWEMVGESPFQLYSGDHGALMFKRRKA